MLELENKIVLDEKTVKSPNLCDRFSEGDLDKIGAVVWEGYDQDKFSRRRWENRVQAATNLAMQVMEAKTFPWTDCANIAFPLVTIAALQFHARAYPATVSGTEIVKYRVIGEDPQGDEMARAVRIGAHMSYQLLEEDESWEEQHDRTLIVIPIMGCAFKKSQRSAAKGHNTSDLVLATDLVMDYFAKSVEDCGRKTHVIPLYRNDIYERCEAGIFRDVRDMPWYQSPAMPQAQQSTSSRDRRTGETPPPPSMLSPFRFLEQHVGMDLDGDGYAEPYIITIEENSHTVVRIVTRFDRVQDITRSAAGNILRIAPTEYFTKYGFIPSPDGSVYDVGFGVLLGPLNETVNTLVNQLVDAGTMSTAAGGFLGRGAKIRGGNYTFAPFQWQRVDSTGDDLRKSLFPLPVREPSMVLFQLLSLLIQYTNRISGSTDTMMGENPGQNTPAYNMKEMVTQGMQIYNNLFKRTWRSMKNEFKKLYVLNAIHMPPSQPFGDKGMLALKADYQGNPARIAPVADPNATSETDRLKQALTLKQMAMSTPGYNMEEVERRVLKAMHVEGAAVLYDPSKFKPGPDPKLALEAKALELKEQALKNAQMEFAMSLMEEQRVNRAKIIKMEAEAMEASANAQGVEAGHKLAAFDSMLGAMKQRDEALRGRIELMMKAMETENGRSTESPPDGGGMEGMAGASGDLGLPPGLEAPPVGPEAAMG